MDAKERMGSPGECKVLHQKLEQKARFTQLFGDAPISNKKIREIFAVVDGDPSRTEFSLSWVNAARHFTDAAWELLGRSIAENSHLRAASLSSCGIDDARASALFRGLAAGHCGLRKLDLSENEIGVAGVAAMAPLLKSCPHLAELDLDGNADIRTEGFNILAEALHGGPVESLCVGRCGIESVAALEHHALPRLSHLYLSDNKIIGFPSLDCTHSSMSGLRQLHLDRNKIGPAGHGSIARLLRQEGSGLTLLSLCSTGMGDDDARVVAEALKNNTALTSLELVANPFGRGGLRAFSTLLNDISSLRGTMNSNHTLVNLGLPKGLRSCYPESVRYVSFALNMNRAHGGRADQAMRAKVIGTQLNRRKRAKLCLLQDIKQSSSHIFSQIAPVLTPDMLALAGTKHGMNELFPMTLATLPDLMASHR